MSSSILSIESNPQIILSASPVARTLLVFSSFVETLSPLQITIWLGHSPIARKEVDGAVGFDWKDSFPWEYHPQHPLVLPPATDLSIYLDRALESGEVLSIYLSYQVLSSSEPLGV